MAGQLNAKRTVNPVVRTPALMVDVEPTRASHEDLLDFQSFIRKFEDKDDILSEVGLLVVPYPEFKVRRSSYSEDTSIIPGILQNFTGSDGAYVIHKKDAPFVTAKRGVSNNPDNEDTITNRWDYKRVTQTRKPKDMEIVGPTLVDYFHTSLVTSAGVIHKHGGSTDHLQNDFWNGILNHNDVVYGEHFSGSLYGPGFGATFWNPRYCTWLVERIAARSPNGEIQGVTSPMLYVSHRNSAFGIHHEHFGLNSLSYGHIGADNACKIWYCIAPKYFWKALALLRKLFPDHFRKCGAAFMHCEFMVDPNIFLNHGIPVHRMVQRVRSWVILNNFVLHFGFSTGYFVSEAVNFGSPRSVKFMRWSVPCTCSHKVPVTLSALDMAELFVKDIEPHIYKLFLEKNSIHLQLDDHPVPFEGVEGFTVFSELLEPIQISEDAVPVTVSSPGLPEGRSITPTTPNPLYLNRSVLTAPNSLLLPSSTLTLDNDDMSIFGESFNSDPLFFMDETQDITLSLCVPSANNPVTPPSSSDSPRCPNFSPVQTPSFTTNSSNSPEQRDKDIRRPRSTRSNSRDSGSQSNNSRIPICTCCDKTYYKADSFRSHIRHRHRTFPSPCTACGITIDTQKAFGRHVIRCTSKTTKN